MKNTYEKANKARTLLLCFIYMHAHTQNMSKPQLENIN